MRMGATLLPPPSKGGSRHCRDAEGWSGWGVGAPAPTRHSPPTPTLPPLQGEREKGP